MLSKSQPNDYSEKEKELLRYFGITDVLFADVPPVTLYRMAVEKAFLMGSNGPQADSLRRCQKALNECKIYRMTPEWDALIKMSHLPEYNFVFKTSMKRAIAKARKELEEADKGLDADEIVTKCSWGLEHCMEVLDQALGAIENGIFPDDE